jgi:hypothetical protein
MQIILTIRVRQRFFQRKQLSTGIISRSAHDLAAVRLLSVAKNQLKQFEIKIYVNFILDVNYLEKPYINKTIIEFEFGFCDILNLKKCKKIKK